VTTETPRAARAADKYYYLPAVLLTAAAVLGGLRAWGALAAFSALFFVCLVFFDEEFSFSGLGIWGLLAAWLAAAVAFSPEPLNSFCEFSRYVLVFSFFIFSSRRGTGARGAWTSSVFLLGAAAAGIAIYEIALGAWRGSVFGLWRGSVLGINPNYSSAFMAAAFAGAAALLSGSEDKKTRFYAAAGTVFFAAGLLAAKSRGGLLAALAALVYLLCLKKAWRTLLYLTAGILLVVAVMPAEQFNVLLKLEQPLSLERLKIWGTALRAISGSPLFGRGPGLFERIFEVFKFPFYNGISYYGHSTLQAHSQLLNLAAEAGIPAACLFAWGWGRAVFTSGNEDKWGMVLKMFAVTLFVQSAVDIIFYSGALQLFFFGTLGLLSTVKARPAAAPGSRARALAFLLACWSAAFILRYGFEREKACALNAGTAPEIREACLKKAMVFAPGDAVLLEASIPLSIGLYGNYAYTAALAGDAALKRPKDPFPRFERAQAFYFAGALASAKTELYGVLSVEPAFLRARLRLAEILAAEKNYPAAAEELRRIEAELARNGPAPATPYDRELRSLPEGPYAAIRRELLKKKAAAGTRR